MIWKIEALQSAISKNVHAGRLEKEREKDLGEKQEAQLQGYYAIEIKFLILYQFHLQEYLITFIST